MSDSLFREHGRQVAALCWRANPALEILLITSLHSQRWIIPKGWTEPGMTPAQSAAREAFEEAGVTGKISDAAVGNYPYLKDRKDGSAIACSVDVFALEVTGQTDDWPEKAERRQMWLPLDDAIARLSEPGLRIILHAFAAQRTQHSRHAS
ncbi:MAG TPA: NUDIX hydrolase [Rhizomicrobium sp.]